MLFGNQFFYYAMTKMFLIIYSLYAKYRKSITDYQRMELIISTALYVIIFGLIAPRILYSPLLQQNIAISSMLYVNWYYWTYVVTNGLNTDHAGTIIYS